MISPRAKRLQLVVDIAQREEDEMARLLGQKQDEHRAELEKLRELENYYNDYSAHSGRRPTQSAAELGKQRQFLQRLSSAIEQQYRQVDFRRREIETARESWQKKHLKTRALTDLIERYNREELRLWESKEQKIIDDLTLARFNISK